MIMIVSVCFFMLLLPSLYKMPHASARIFVFTQNCTIISLTHPTAFVKHFVALDVKGEVKGFALFGALRRN